MLSGYATYLTGTKRYGFYSAFSATADKMVRGLPGVNINLSGGENFRALFFILYL